MNRDITKTKNDFKVSPVEWAIKRSFNPEIRATLQRIKSEEQLEELTKGRKIDRLKKEIEENYGERFYQAYKDHLEAVNLEFKIKCAESIWGKGCTKRLEEDSRDIPPEFVDIVNDHFWELI